MLNKKIPTVLAIIIFAALGFYLYTKNNKENTAAPVKQEPVQQKDISKEPPFIVSTNPDPLEDNLVSGVQVVEITFNRPLENVGEFKSRIEPKIEYRVELSPDRKTARITPLKPYPLGTTFTLFIGPDSKFDGVGAWGKDKVYHFKTIKYTGV
ncbi:hypothetical protein HYS95_03170 [Candidatus Daviesbacteria bacterium]|nr:hypothetical protein [Candidatus Daviesbacteria bacterium]